MTRAISAAVLLLVASGCASMDRSLPGPSSSVFGLPFTTEGFVPDERGYRIPFVDAERYRFVSADWRVDNYRLDDETERPRAREAHSDVDLSLQNRRNNGVIWIESFVLRPAVEQTELRVLAENFAGSIARGGYFRASVDGDEIAYEDRRYAAVILDTAQIRVGGRPAFVSMMDISNLQQHEVDESSRTARALVVFVRPPTDFVERNGFAVRDVPMLFVSGYVNSPTDFDTNLSDFVRFLGSIEFLDTNGRPLPRPPTGR